MDRTHRCELLAELPDSEIAEIAERAGLQAIGEPVTISGPSVGMIMMRVVDGARGDLFNFGEVLVTECHVQVDGHEGWAMLMGSRPTAARNAATLDAAIAAGRIAPEPVDALVASLVARHEAERASERETLAATRVRFETQ
jgi:alpha-D-ribose 1-methylphosphonate 5-triphosphate synthase subunit PhnG